MGVAIGVISAIKRGSLLDRAAMGFALFGVSAPVFWLGLVALWVFWREAAASSPGTGYVPFAESPKDWFTHMILPCFVFALLYAAFYARMTRGNLLETMGEDYIRTARAKGLSERKVIVKHGLRASLTPVVTMFGMDIALLIGGAVIIETVFNWQGVGSWVIRATFTANLPVVVAVVLMGADRRRDPEPDRRHRLRLPRSAGAVPVSRGRATSCSRSRTSSVEFPTPDGVVNAVDRLSFTAQPGRDVRDRR